MRTYLVVIDETDEAQVALRYASRRAARTGGNVHILALIPPQDFVAWSGVQATIEEEARSRAETLLASAAGTLFHESGIRPAITVMQGTGTEAVRKLIEDEEEIAALVLGAAPEGNPGPLVTHFTGPGAGTLPCPVMVIPGSLSRDEIDKLS